MLKKIKNFILRLTLCTFTFHKAEETKVQSHREYDIYICKRCGNLFGSKKEKYKK
jgi:hypothetical protein